MEHYIIFDNGGKTPDRYTLIDKRTGDVYGISENPYASSGIGTHVGNCAAHHIVLYGAGWRQKMPSRKIIQAEIDNYVNNARLHPDWLGIECNIKDLPEPAKRYIFSLGVHHSPLSAITTAHKEKKASGHH